MAHKSLSFVLAFLLAFTTFLAISGKAAALRNMPTNPKTVEKKQPQWLVDPDGSALIPGIGRVMLPPFRHIPFYKPGGGIGSIGSGSGSGNEAPHRYVPGADDTFVPNPGFEVPNPAGSGGIPAESHP